MHTHRLLRKSEKYFKTDMVYLAKGGFWLTLSQITVSLLGLLLSIGFANLLSQESYGTYRYILSLGGIITAFSLSGLNNAIMRSAAHGKEGTLLWGFWKNLQWSSIIVLISIAISSYYYLNGNNMLALGMLIIGSFSPFIDSAELYNAFLNGKKDFRTASILRIVRNTVPFLALITTIFITNNPLLIIFIYFISHAVTVILIFIYTIRYKTENSLVEEDALKTGKHISIMNTVASTVDKIDNVLLFHYFGPAQLAIYNFALAIPNNIGGMLKNISILAIPKFAKSTDKEATKKAIVKKSLLLSAGLFPVIIGYVIFAPLIFEILFPKYISAVFYSQLFMLVLFFNSTLPYAYIEAHKAIRERYILNISSNILKLCLLVGGIIYFGVLGAIVARIISKLYVVVMVYILMKKV